MRREEIASAILASQPPAGMSSRIVAVDGPGGAGKSTFAAGLSTALGGAPIVPTDDFASWDVALLWWPRLIEQVLLPLASNQPARYQRYDWVDRRLAEWRVVPVAPAVVIEGVSAARDEFLPYLSYTIWIETPADERLRRGLERDGAQARQQWLDWMAAEDGYRAEQHPDERADLVVDGTVPLETDL